MARDWKEHKSVRNKKQLKNQKVFQSKTESVLLRTHTDVRKYTQDFFYRPVLRAVVNTDEKYVMKMEQK
jgi:hypothetical protein